MNEEKLISDLKIKMTGNKTRRYSQPDTRRVVRQPEEILRDVRGLKLRQRVSLVLGDESFKEELEDSIRKASANGVSSSSNIRSYQDFLLPVFQPSLITIGRGYGNAATVLPINDIRGENTVKYSKVNKSQRCKLAAVYRLIDMFGWSEAIFNHVTLQVGDKNEFLINPFGLLFNEITASSLVTCDLNGDIIDSGSTGLCINKAGFLLHSAIHEARTDIKCVIHVHTADVVAVSAMKCGFLRISQESIIVGNVSYHDYYGIIVDDMEKEIIKNDLGPKNMILFLRNHGVAVCGTSIEDAFHRLFNVMEACAAQVKALSVGLENLNIISEEAYEKVQKIMEEKGRSIFYGEGRCQIPLDECFFEAHMRLLDSQGYRTGYTYHMPDVFISGKSSKKMPDCCLPPQATSDREMPYHVYYDFCETKSRSPSLGMGNSYQNKMKWLNSPVLATQYVKESPAPATLLDEGVKTNSVQDDVFINETEIVTCAIQNGNTGNKEVCLDVVPTKPEPRITVDNQVCSTVETNESGVVITTTPLKNDRGSTDHCGSATVLTFTPLKSDLGSTDNCLTPSLNSESGSVQSNLDGKSSQKLKKQKSFKEKLMKKLHFKEEKTK
ncbi:alpha-adducin isoform X1 [Hydra vulgaris]|uniref:alpha-adducin isoform X1 n=1 Tax=Hydra vulgaris TaxID=6087 RepID=UPI001F5EF607|nr:alpha-adducin-like [Hydra vulgaris]